MCPFIIGIAGRGIVSDGAQELITSCMPNCVEFVKPDQLKDIPKNCRDKVYVTVLSREHYMKNKGDS